MLVLRNHELSVYFLSTPRGSYLKEVFRLNSILFLKPSAGVSKSMAQSTKIKGYDKFDKTNAQ
jgi:hypothetical protein